MLSDLSSPPLPENALLDKITVNFKGWDLHYQDEDEFRAFIRCMRMADHVDGLNRFELAEELSNAGEPVGAIFQSWQPFYGNGLSGKLHVKKLQTDIPQTPYGDGVPLFGGYLEIKSRRPMPRSERDNTGGVSKAIMTLALNPTRFFSYQNFESDDIQWVSRRRRFGELDQPLDRSDNVVPRHRFENFENPDLRRSSLQIYCGGVIELIERDLCRVAQHFNVRVVRIIDDEKVSVRGIECYWELACQDSLSLLNSIRGGLIAIGRENRIGNYPASIDGRTHNSPSSRIQLIKGVSLSVYAKTQSRVRFEVCYDFSKADQCVGRRTTGASVIGPIVARIAREASEEAASRLAPILSRLPTAADETMSMLSLIEKVNESVSTPEQASFVFRQLVGTRIFSAQDLVLREIAVNLEERGVLARCAPRVWSYRLTSEVQLLFDEVFPLSL